MTWLKLDDRFHENRKVKRAWRTARGSIGLHALALTYCASQETNGLVDAEFVEEKLPNPRERATLVAALVDAGLWVESPDGWLIYNYLKHNPSAEQLVQMRAEKREAGRRGGLASGRSRREATAEALAEAGGSSKHEPGRRTPIPSHPIDNSTAGSTPEVVGGAVVELPVREDAA